MSEFHKSFAVRLKKCRKRAALSQRELAHRAGVSGEFISRMERGITLPAMETFSKMCAALGCGPNELLLDGRRDAVSGLEGRLAAASPDTAKMAIRAAEAILAQSGK